MFSTNSFSQASFSTNAFKQSQVAPGDCKFWAVGVWSKGFWANGFWCDGATKVEARSGYWRAFFYQLQEEELKKHEQKQREEAQKRTGQGSETKPVEPKLRVVKKPRREIDVEIWVPPVLPKPVYVKPPRVEIPPITQFLNIISNEFRSWLNPYESRLTDWEATEAANDDEHDIELLLLAA